MHNRVPYLCNSEIQARNAIGDLNTNKEWPCLFTKSDTTGEKDFEEFYTDAECLMLDKYLNIGIIKKSLIFDKSILKSFLLGLNDLKENQNWKKTDIIKLIRLVLPDFKYSDNGKYLDGKM